MSRTVPRTRGPIISFYRPLKRRFPRTRGDRPNTDLQVLSLEHLPSTGGERIETNPGGPLRASSAGELVDAGVGRRQFSLADLRM